MPIVYEGSNNIPYVLVEYNLIRGDNSFNEWYGISCLRVIFTFAFTSDLILIVMGWNRNIIPIIKVKWASDSTQSLILQTYDRENRLHLSQSLAQMITSMRGCAVHNDLCSWPISSRSFSHELAIKVLRYGTSCPVRSTACTVLEDFFTYLAQMKSSMRRCVARNDLWHWPISSKLLSCDIANFMDIHIWHRYNPWGDDVSHAISRSIGPRSRSHGSFTVLQPGRQES